MVAVDDRRTYKAASIRMDVYAAVVIISLFNALSILGRDTQSTFAFWGDVFFGPGWLTDLGMIAGLCLDFLRGSHYAYF